LTEIIHDKDQLRQVVRRWKAAGQIVGVVPTMGALHAGHLSLVRAAMAECERVIVTIFVNPKQFNNPEDLRKYPRGLDNDAALIARLGADVIFAPLADHVYPDGFATHVSVSAVAEPLEGASRPGHFDGVATVVAKLFGMTLADRAYFGQKDWQQLQVVKRMVRDLNMPVWIVGCETIREADGLAMSSRNARLGAQARKVAPLLYAAMITAAGAIRAGQINALDHCTNQILAAGFDKVDYVELRDAATLATPVDLDRPLRLLVAAWLDDVRLIDNIPV
jgi:pantoate--beta-alanine ligase